MISLTRISKQYGRQMLFVDATFQLNPGEKVGLVGPNGSGKTTVFRMMTGEETPDEGEISIPKKLTIGYFRQDVEEMSGRPVLDEVTAGSGRVGDLHHELEELNRAMSDPARAGEMDAVLARFGDVQEEYEHLGGYALEAQAREVLHGLGFEDDRIDGDVGALSGGWKMRVAMARVLVSRPDVLLMDEPTNHLDIESIIWLEGFLKSRPGALLMTSHDREFMNRIVTRVAEIDGGEIAMYSGNYPLLRARVRDPRSEPGGRVRQTAGDAGQGAAVHRAVRRPRCQGRAGAEPGEGARQDRADRAAEEAPGREVRLPGAAALGRSGGRARGRHQGLRPPHGPQRAEHDDPPRRAVVRDGKERRRQIDAVEDGRRADRAGRGHRPAGREPQDGYFAQQSLDLVDPDLTIEEQLRHDFPDESIGALRNLAGAFQFSGEDVDKKIRALSGGERTRLVLARMLLNPPNFLVLDEPTNHLNLATKEMLLDALKDFDGTMLFVSHDRAFLRGLGNRVLELGGESGTDAQPHLYPGSYVEYVERTGHEAPGVHT